MDKISNSEHTTNGNQDYLEDILKLEYQLCFRLYMVSRNMTRLYTPILESFNLTYPQYIILLALFEHGYMDFKVLSDLVDLKTGTMTPILQRMEENGLVIREKNKSDARKINIFLTQKGKALKKELMHVPLEITKRIGLSEASYQVLVTQLDALAEQLAIAQIQK